MSSIETGVCVRTGYASEYLAKSKIAAIKRGRKKRAKYRFYDREYNAAKCAVCGSWHLMSGKG